MFSIVSGVMAIHAVAQIGVSAWAAGHLGQVAIQLLFATCLMVVLAGSWAYLLPRMAYYRRLQTHAPVPQATVMAALDQHRPSLTILVPSYKEELAVVWQTLMSAALQDVPDRRVVLLIDDPQNPRDEGDAQALAAMRTLTDTMQADFNRVRSVLAGLASAAHAAEPQTPVAVDSTDLLALAEAHRHAATWLGEMAARAGSADHTARWLVAAVLQPLAEEHHAASRLWAARAADHGASRAEVCEQWARLLSRFTVEMAYFERKRYANLSHEPNKAMNLNAYLSLMGGRYHAVQGAKGLTLNPVAPDAADAIQVPEADFVLTLDADSLLLPGYAPRLLEVMLRSGNERLAVIQTPYSAVPGAPGVCERVAGAQTDIQYIMHQGYTAHGATFWVGANALLRMTAIEDIATVHVENGNWIKRYIHDRTVIEDTESSVDLVDKGWRLYNYNERLAYSATPPDFGSLLIQRRRWADGGLIILPKALRYLVRGPWTLAKGAEAFLRVHYLSSIATVNFAFLLIMFGPFSQNLSVYWIPLAMTPYMLAYARDLRHCGYGWGDFPRVYALNLLLLPVNLGGTLRSLYQAITGRRAAFARTPKVVGRTAAPGGYVMVELALVGVCAALMVWDLFLGRWVGAAMSALYVALLSYAITRFIGWRACAEDLRLWFKATPLSRVAGPAPAQSHANHRSGPDTLSDAVGSGEAD